MKNCLNLLVLVALLVVGAAKSQAQNIVVANGSGSPCISAASPATCGTAKAGIVAIPPTIVVPGINAIQLVVNTTAVTATSIIIPINNTTLGSLLGVTCDLVVANAGDGVSIVARVPGVSFTLQVAAIMPVTSTCVNFLIL